MSKLLRKELGIPLKDLYLKYKEWQGTREDGYTEDYKAAADVFGIDEKNKEVLFFLTIGLRSMESEIDSILQGEGEQIQ